MVEEKAEAATSLTNLSMWWVIFECNLEKFYQQSDKATFTFTRPPPWPTSPCGESSLSGTWRSLTKRQTKLPSLSPNHLLDRLLHDFHFHKSSTYPEQALHVVTHCQTTSCSCRAIWTTDFNFTFSLQPFVYYSKNQTKVLSLYRCLSTKHYQSDDVSISVADKAFSLMMVMSVKWFLWHLDW